MVNVANAGIPACRTIASHTARPIYRPVVLKWLMSMAYRNVCVCVCVCVRACVRACVRVCQDAYGWVGTTAVVLGTV